MTEEERESLIAQLAFVKGMNQSVFENYTDEQLLMELKELYWE